MNLARFSSNTSRFLQRGFDVHRVTLNACRLSSCSGVLLEKLSRSEYNRSEERRKSKAKYLLYPGLSFFGLFKTEEPEEDDEEKLTTTIKRSVLLMQAGEYKKAESMLHIALRQAQLLQHEDGITYVYDLLANLAFDVADYKKARTLFVSVMQRLLSNGVAESDLRIIHISLKMAKILEYQGQLGKAEDGYQFCLKRLAERVVGDEDEEKEDAASLNAMIHDWYARMLLTQSRHAEAFQHFSEAHRVCSELYGDLNERTILLLNSLGTVRFEQGNDDEALRYFSTAVDNGEKLEEMEELDMIHVNLGNVLMRKGLLKEAEDACRNGWKLAKAKDSQRTQAEAASCLSELKKLLKSG